MEEYLILIILHLLGDFYLQTTKVAQCKNARIGSACGVCKKCKEGSWINWKYLLIHSLLYIVPFTILCFVMKGIDVIVIIGVLFISHTVIDGGSCYFNKKSKQTAVFVVDQALHTGLLFLLHQFVAFSYHIDAGCYSILKIMFIGLMLVMPSSILINKLLKDVYPQSAELGMFDIGSIIGIMERILTFIFACFESFPAIAIIITVKTWARTNDLKEPEFRNKYLLGTLTSLVLALIVFCIYKSI
ncbi:Protein of unknown function [Lachnospiraceae bacterium XBB1006]|nr:Protein of unknown function [Lachnospiraceae bacterium XBB1006]